MCENLGGPLASYPTCRRQKF